MNFSGNEPYNSFPEKVSSVEILEITVIAPAVPYGQAFLIILLSFLQFSDSCLDARLVALDLPSIGFGPAKLEEFLQDSQKGPKM